MWGIRFAVSLAVIVLATTALLAEETAKKTAVPGDKAQADALALIREVYKDEYAEATTPEKEADLAKKLVEKASATNDDSSDKFVLLRVARDLAAQAGDSDTTFGAVDQLSHGFDIDALEMKWDVLTKIASVSKKAEDQEQVVDAALSLVAQALARDKYDAAEQLGKLALSSAHKAKSQALVKRVQAFLKDVAKAAKVYEEVEAAMKTLEEKPVDPAANLVVGRYLCLVKGNWRKGRPMLALGNDAALKALALKEIEGMGNTVDQVKLADDWWDLAQKETGATQKSLQCRAQYWYGQALPQLTGLMKDKVEKRVAELGLSSGAELAESNPEAKSSGRSQRDGADHLRLMKALKKKLHGKVAFDSKTGVFVLTYDWKSHNQLKDFEVAGGQPMLVRGELGLRGGDSIRHVVDFKEVTVAVPILVSAMKGTIIKTSGGVTASVGGWGSDTIYLNDGKNTSQFIVPDGQRKGIQPVRLAVAQDRLGFEYGNGTPSQVGKAVSNFRAGQVELHGGEVGFQYGKLILAGVIDKEWAARLLSKSNADPLESVVGKHASSENTTGKSDDSTKGLVQIRIFREGNWVSAEVTHDKGQAYVTRFDGVKVPLQHKGDILSWTTYIGTIFTVNTKTRKSPV